METKRVVVPEAEEILGVEFKCLDHGFVSLVEYMGSDETIVQAARVSYGRGTRKTRDNRGLIRYLMRHKHTSPFEMVEMIWHCKMPIFVARQWIRHRTASVNEYSLRYSEPEEDFYTPSPGEVRFQSVTNRQGSSEEIVPPEIANKVIGFIMSMSESGIRGYEEAMKDNIAKELARVGLPINIYTRWIWKNDLHNTLHFLHLRLDRAAQYELRVYAERMAEIIRSIVPLSYEAFEDYVLKAVTFSRQEICGLRKLINGANIDKVIGCVESQGERGEFKQKLEKVLAEGQL